MLAPMFTAVLQAVRHESFHKTGNDTGGDRESQPGTVNERAPTPHLRYCGLFSVHTAAAVAVAY